MPLVFAENEDTESGIHYADYTGVSYQFPPRYRRLIQVGERFVYYRGRKQSNGTRQPQVYFGTGIVGPLRPDAASQGRWSCDVLDYSPFAEPLNFKNGNSSYFEIGGSRRGYFQPGVRRISDKEYESILAAAGSSSASNIEISANELTASAGYASRETLLAIERYAVHVALAELKSEFPSASIKEQARNNPGFDILVTTESGKLFVEVKGTARNAAVFIITDGEVQFSKRNSENYRLLLIHDIRLDRATHSIYRHLGAVDENTFMIEPLQWRCKLP